MSFRVLLLEADESLSRELGDALVERGCEVVTIADPEEGVSLAATERFDLILVSPELPGVAGFELGDRIRNDPATAGVPLVVMSSTSPHVAASMDRPRPSVPPSRDLRDTVRSQERTLASMRADLATRGGVIDRLTAKTKELTQRLTEVQTMLDDERKQHGAAVAELAAIRETHAAELHAIVLQSANEAAERERAHAEETEFIERAHEEAAEAAARRLQDSERNLVAARSAHTAEEDARALEIAELREMATTLTRERDVATAERDEARTLAEKSAMDAAQARMDLAEEARMRAAESQASAARMAELEKALARTETFGAELADAQAKLAEAKRALEEVERDAIQQQLARDAAFHDLSFKAAEDLRAATEAAKAAAAAEREALIRKHEAEIKTTRDKAIAQTLAVARERKKQQS